MTLKARAILRFAVGLAVSAALLFLPAGSLRFWQGWLFTAVTWGFLLPVFLYVLKHDPKLMERRMQHREKEPEQKLIKVALSLIYFAAFTLPGFDFRFGWSRAWLGPLPLWVVLAGQAVVLAGYLLIFWVMRVNSFASRTIQVEAGQKVVNSGPYAVVRHPMYSGIVLMMLATPLALGSYVALPAFVLVVPLLVLRLINEEKVLRRDLPGYVYYCQRTCFRLLPGVW